MIIQDLLQANYEKLLEQYNRNLEGVLSLQVTLIRDILPSIKDELELSPEATEWAKEWLEDTYSIFRIFRRNDFTRSFAMESIRKNLLWRLSNMWPLHPPTPTPHLHCLPGSVRDPFGRPILVIEVISVTMASDTSRPHIIQMFERLRCHLKRLNDGENPGPRPPVLQYVILLDLSSLSFRDFNIELLSWTLREIVPRFPGMLAGVFMLNYSWTHTGLWNVIKRVLPQSALSRVFFPTQDELVQYFTPSFLPKDYGGSLPALPHLSDPLQSSEAPSSRPQGQSQPDDLSPAYQPPVATTSSFLSPTSLLNPFFGYPASSTHGFTSLQHGRRRKRDLARTLARLFWIRWQKHLVITLLLIICVFGAKLAARQRLLHYWKGSLQLGVLLSSRLNRKLLHSG